MRIALRRCDIMAPATMAGPTKGKRRPAWALWARPEHVGSMTASSADDHLTVGGDANVVVGADPQHAAGTRTHVPACWLHDRRRLSCSGWSAALMRAANPSPRGSGRGAAAVKNAMGDALGSCADCTRIGMDSYERPVVAYTSARKPKVLKMGPVKSPVQTFHSQIGGSSSGPCSVPCGHVGPDSRLDSPGECTEGYSRVSSAQS